MKQRNIMVCPPLKDIPHYLPGTKAFCSKCGQVVFIAIASVNAVRKDIKEDVDLICMECLMKMMQSGENFELMPPTPEIIKGINEFKRNNKK